MAGRGKVQEDRESEERQAGDPDLFAPQHARDCKGDEGRDAADAQEQPPHRPAERRKRNVGATGLVDHDRVPVVGRVEDWCAEARG